MFNSTKLRQVISVDRHGSFSRAAEALHITQSTVTKAVSDVERELGYALYDRKAHGAVATAEGRDFLNRATRIISDLELLSQDARARKSEDEALLRIAVCPPSMEGLLNNALASFVRDYPAICVNLSTYQVERGLIMLERGDVDLLIGPAEIFGNDPDYQIVGLGVLTAHIFSRLDHPLAKLDNLSRDDIAEYMIISPDLVSQYAIDLIDLFQSAGDDEPLKRIHVIENFPIVMNLVQSSQLLGTVGTNYSESRFFRERFHVFDFEVFRPMPLACGFRSKWLPSKAMRAFIAALREHPPGKITGK